MASSPKKISELTDGTGVQAGDLMEIERPGDPAQSMRIPVPTPFSGSYEDLTLTPDFHAVALSGKYGDLDEKPTFHAVALSGDFDDLDGKPFIPTVRDTATFNEFNTALGGRWLSNESVWADVVALTDAATIAVNLNNGYDFGGAANGKLNLGGNRTLGAPTNSRTGKKGILWFGATGSTRTLTLHENWLLVDGVETGPYEIETTQTLGIAYACLGSSVFVTGIVKRG